MNLLSRICGKGTALLFIVSVITLIASLITIFTRSSAAVETDFSKYQYQNTLAAYSNSSSVVDPISDLRIYQIMVESFNNGDDSINYNIGLGPSYHKGDLQGIIDALPYIKDLGMNAIWMTPIFEAEKTNTIATPLDATAYYARDYYKIDRHFGDEEKLKELVDSAHALGLYVFLDGVFGHFKGDLEDSSPSGKKPTTSKLCILPDNLYEKESVLANPVIRHTLCADYDDEGQSLEFFKEVATYYVSNFKIDGWRLDQAYQVPIDAWREIRKAVEEASEQVTYKDAHGNDVHPLGYMVAELWNPNSVICEFGYGSDDNPSLNSAFDFNGRTAILKTFAATQSGRFSHKATELRNYLIENEQTLPAHAYPNLMITNHDTVRLGDLIQRAGLEKDYVKRIKLALSFMSVTHSGPITNYYGEEIGQEVPNFDVAMPDHYVLDDGMVSRDTGKISDFSAQENEIRELFKALMHIRAKHGSISNGKLEFIEVNDSVFCIRKSFNGDSSFIYALNTDPNREMSIRINDLDRYKEVFDTDCIGKDGDLVIKPLDFVLLEEQIHE
ncbi:MAG: alpha-amylase family glycosyl hydrolase [Succinivibrio sp.]